MRLRIAILLTVCLAGAGFTVTGQEDFGRGRIHGVVVDEQGAPVVDALVVAKSREGRTKLEGRSDENGRFAIAGLGSGAWRVTASKNGYIDSEVVMNVKQLRANPPITFTLNKIKGAAAVSSDKELAALFEKGDALLSRGDYVEAQNVFQEFAAKYPEVYQVHLNIGMCYLKTGELDKAQAEFELVLEKVLAAHGDYKKDPAATQKAFSGLGEVALKRDDFETAQNCFSRALEISPQDEVAAYNVGEIFFSSQRIDEAIAYFERAISVKPDWSRPYLRLGYVYLNKGDMTKALESFQTFIRLDPDHPEVPQVKNMIATIEKIKK
ncbi:MAG: tetratricopeptide repeat protein [Candidatus Aminicenantes bacterium]|nr:tetratricopeptide repeat protein [Candidatus Aminicenantes bacterium]